MAKNVLGNKILVGDVIQDKNMLGDTHPYLVVAKAGGVLTLQPMSSHEASYYVTVATIKPENKSGDPKWVGCTSYLCGQSQIGSNLINVAEGVSYPDLVTDPQSGYQYIASFKYYLYEYRVVGTVLSDKMKEILK